MTNRTRFQIAIAGLILSVITFLVFTYVPQIAGTKAADFWQGFSGGIALSSFLGVLQYGRELRRARA